MGLLEEDDGDVNQTSGKKIRNDCKFEQVVIILVAMLILETSGTAQTV